MIRRLITPFMEIIKRIQRSRLRRIMRGYRILRQSGHLDRIAVVKQALTEHTLGLSREHFLSVVMGCGAASGEVVVRQYLLDRLGHTSLNRALLLALGCKRGKVVYPLPQQWREVLTLHSFEVAHYRSALLWQFFVCAHLLYGVVKICKIVLAGITSKKSTVLNQKHYVYFYGLVPGNLPHEIKGAKSHDVISWYLQWPGRKPDIGAIYHSVADSSPVTVGNIAVLSQHGALPALTGWGHVTNYAAWGLCASVIAMVDCLRGRWWHALLLNQAALAAQVRNLPADALAREYLFHLSGWIYRPLWTYEAERLGSEITFYYYATNNEAFKRSNSYSPPHYGWRSMSWPRYLVWDEYQADVVRRAVGEQAKISIVGPIWMNSSAIEMPQLEGLAVAVFDITPHRQSVYCVGGLDYYEFHIPATSNRFLEHVANATYQHDVAMLWKRKRKIGAMAHPHYRHFADRLSERKNVVSVDPDISALRVIESSCAVISMPFTSTALIARAMGKPSIYYDPTGQLERDDRAAHGIPIISGVDELEAWLSAQVA